MSFQMKIKTKEGDEMELFQNGCVLSSIIKLHVFLVGIADNSILLLCNGKYRDLCYEHRIK